MKPPFTSRIDWLMPVLTFLPLIASAQSDTTPRGDVLQLSPFEVTAAEDRGYTANTSLGATRTNTPLIELPQNIQVYNAQFIHDVAATDTWEVLRFSSNIVGGDRRGDDTGGTGTMVRGYTISKRLDGLDFPFAPTNTDPALYERVELVKGSSSVLFGSTSPGGIINYVTKKPSLKSATSLTLRGGSYDFGKVTLDSTGPLLRREGLSLAYRLVGSFEDSETVRRFEFRKTQALAGSIEARLGSATTIRVRLEHFDQHRREAISIPVMWEPTPAVTNPPGGTVITAPGIPIDLPDDFYRGEPDDYKNSEFTRQDLVVEHRLSSTWVARLSAARTDWFALRDEAPILGQSTTFPLVTRRKQHVMNREGVDFVDVTILGDFTLGSTTHRLLGGYTYSQTDRAESQIQWALTPNFDLFAPVYGVSIRGPATVASNVLRDTVRKALFVQDQAKFFDERLHLTLGLRQDKLEPFVRNLVSNTTSNLVQDKVSPRYSALYRIRDDLSVYAAYNETFQPATATRGDGTLLDPPTTEIMEAGLKFALLGGKLSGSGAIFRAELGNQSVPDTRNPGFSLQTSYLTQGAEADFTYALGSAWQLLGSVGYLQTEITRNDTDSTIVGNRRYSAPKWTSALWARWEGQNRFKGLSFGGGFNYGSSRFDSDANRFLLPGYTVVNALARYSWQRYTLSVNAQNLLDKRYISQIEAARFAVRGEPRRFFATFTVTF